MQDVSSQCHVDDALYIIATFLVLVMKMYLDGLACILFALVEWEWCKLFTDELVILRI